MTVHTRSAGEFCWVNILTPNPTAARAFFSALFGWTYSEMSGMGNGIRLGDAEIGGVFDIHGPNTPKGMPPQIGVLIKVDDADATAAAINALGGKALGTFNVMDEGRMSVCFDPNGAQFDIWQSLRPDGNAGNPREHGAPSWFETMTTDVEPVRNFYEALFGWTSSDTPMPQFTYTTFSLRDAPVAGAYPIQPNMGPSSPHWDTYFTVRDVDATVAQAKALHATVGIEATDIPGIGRFAGIVSPQGVLFYVITYAR